MLPKGTRIKYAKPDGTPYTVKLSGGEEPYYGTIIAIHDDGKRYLVEWDWGWGTNGTTPSSSTYPLPLDEDPKRNNCGECGKAAAINDYLCKECRERNELVA